MIASVQALVKQKKEERGRDKVRESVRNLIRGSYNGPQYIVTLQSPESVAKHSIYTRYGCFLKKSFTVERASMQALVKQQKRRKGEGQSEREWEKLDKRELQWSTIYCDPTKPRISGETFH